MEFNGKTYQIRFSEDNSSPCSECIFNGDLTACSESPSCFGGYFEYAVKPFKQSVEQLLKQALTTYNKQYCSTLVSLYPTYSLAKEVLSLGITSQSILK